MIKRAVAYIDGANLQNAVEKLDWYFELVLTGVRNYFESNTDKVVLVSSDGDYKCVVKFFKEKGVDVSVVSPYEPRFCSKLIRKTRVPIYYINDKRKNLESKKKDPNGH